MSPFAAAYVGFVEEEKQTAIPRTPCMTYTMSGSCRWEIRISFALPVRSHNNVGLNW